MSFCGSIFLVRHSIFTANSVERQKYVIAFKGASGCKVPGLHGKKIAPIPERVK
jgi:hypothetical protein